MWCANQFIWWYVLRVLLLLLLFSSIPLEKLIRSNWKLVVDDEVICSGQTLTKHIYAYNIVDSALNPGSPFELRMFEKSMINVLTAQHVKGNLITN